MSVNRLASVCSSFLSGNCLSGESCKLKHILEKEHDKKRKRDVAMSNISGDENSKSYKSGFVMYTKYAGIGPDVDVGGEVAQFLPKYM